MKLPKTNFEQKCWIVVLVFILSYSTSLVFAGDETLLKWTALLGILSLTSVCIIAKKKNWISKENKL